MTRILLMAAVAAAALATAQRPAQAYFDKPWCAVTNEGGDVHWSCEYDTVEQCAPVVAAGSRGFCNMNPYYQGKAPRRPAARHHRRRY